jgi:hypothetical protein
MDANQVSAAPTKQFFISVLVKDISLLDAIVELVDNSVDAARSNLGPSRFKEVLVQLSFNKDHFSISDNSGGMTIEHARSSAFRFGRDPTAPVTPGTVGEFGVGMKRALFKLGRHFVVSSRTQQQQFTIDVDVDEWENRPDQNTPDTWTFSFKNQGANSDSAQPLGTEITVDRLLSFVSLELSSQSFQNRLAENLRQAHAESLTQGLQIVINNIPVQGRESLIKESDGLRPIVKEGDLDIHGKTVRYRLAAGIGEPKLIDAGWHIYCNGRQIERAEKSEKTGWNTTLEESDKTPKAHWQFRRFRGYVYFESKSQDVLPWNTTKTSLDIEAPAYLRIFPEMTAALRQVLAFLNALDAESSQPGELTALVDNAKPTRVAELAMNDVFTATAAPVSPQAKEIRITYVKPAEMVDAVKRHLGATNNRELGEKTFDYYVQNEGIDG